MGEAVHVWGQGVYGKSLYLPLNFADPKTALKNKLFKNKLPILAEWRILQNISAL